MKCQGPRMLERTGLSYAQLCRTAQPETLPPLQASTLSPAMLAEMRRWIIHLNGWATVSYFDNGWLEFLFAICRSLPFASIYTVNAASVMTSPCACCQEEATIDPWQNPPGHPRNCTWGWEYFEKASNVMSDKWLRAPLKPILSSCKPEVHIWIKNFNARLKRFANNWKGEKRTRR